MLFNVFGSFVQTHVQAGDTIANTAVITPFATSHNYPANQLSEGVIIFISAGGVYSTPVVAARSLNCFVSTSSGAITATGIRTPTAVGATDFYWTMEAKIILTASGANGLMEGNHVWRFYDSAQLTDNVWTYASPVAAPFDTTISNDVGLAIKYSVADPANAITMRQLAVYAGY